jgi:para-nitrobenzyl esterase
VLKEAGLAPGDMSKLQQMPWKEYYALANKAVQKLAADMAASGPAGMRRGFAPVVDGTVLPQHPYYPDAAPTAASVPMIICSTMNEQAPAWLDASLAGITLDEVAEKVKARAGFGAGFGDKAADVVRAYAKAFPNRKPVEIWSLVSSNRQSVVTLADAKSKQPPGVYVSWFAWQPPLFDGRIGAFHCVDISFWFYNTDLMLTHTGGGARPRRLSARMAKSLVQFMKTGDPNGAGLMKWPRYTAARGETLVLDDVCEAKNDPDREARRALPTV